MIDIGKPITGIILAGGQSKRMGSDKGLIIYKGKKLVEYPVAVLNVICSKVLISSNSNAYKFLSLQLIPDIYPSIGPIGGIYSGLLASVTSDNLFLPGDMPFVDQEILNILLGKKAEFEIIVPSVNSWPIPVCGYYNTSILPELEKQISTGKYSLQDLIRNCNSLVIDIKDEKLVGKLKNINTREDLISG
jgi:molybdopterin-guanine dinucleotide biosynthesis protein A